MRCKLNPRNYSRTPLNKQNPKSLQTNAYRKNVLTKKDKIVKKIVVSRGAPDKPIPAIIPRPKNLENLATDVKRLQLPEAGSFNSGLIKIPNENRYAMVYRPDEHRFIGCFLRENLTPDKHSYFKFSFSNCADPRLMWTPNNKLLMIYSSTSGIGTNHECIRGSVIMDLNKSMNFIDGKAFRVSPEHIQSRQKNWMPFCHEDKIYLVASVCPHIIYEMKISDNNEVVCEQQFETPWESPWIFKEFLRGNTNAVRLEDGNYLGTFHTAIWSGSKCYYDNGCYMFEGKPPFKVLKCSSTTYLPAEAAVEPYFRNKDRILCTFPVGLVREGNQLLISYGDNDSCVKIMKTTVEQMMSLMVEVK